MVCSLWTKRSEACDIFSSELTSHVSLHHHLVFQRRESLVPWSKPIIPPHCNSSPLCSCVSLSSYKSPTATEIPTGRSQRPWLTGWRGASGLGKVPRRWVGQGYRDSSNASSAQREKVGRVEEHRGRSSEGHRRIRVMRDSSDLLKKTNVESGLVAPQIYPAGTYEGSDFQVCKDCYELPWIQLQLK